MPNKVSPPFEHKIGQDTGELGGLYPALQLVLHETRRELVRIKSSDNKQQLSQQEINSIIQQCAKRLGLQLNKLENDQILSYLERESHPFGPLQELVDDPSVSDIIVINYNTIFAQRQRQNTPTHLSFPSQGAYEAFVERLLQKCGASYSTKQPIADGMYGNHARIHVVHRCLCESGPYLTIRLNRFGQVTLKDLITSGLAPKPIFYYLEQAILNHCTVMIAGEVGTGKTTLIRALCSTIPPNQSVLVIEDTPEIKLFHPNVRYLTTRGDNLEGIGGITSSQCIKAGMRMAMNRIIFGEIRDAEAAESFIDVCTSGHSGLSTIHARSAQEAISRLQLFLRQARPGTSQQDAAEQLASAISIIIYVNVCHVTGRRRVFEVREIGPIADNVLRQRPIFCYATESAEPVWKLQSRMTSIKNHQGEAFPLNRYPTELFLKDEHLSG